MQLPSEIPSELKKYNIFRTEEELLEELKKHPAELMSFFLYACDDETWTESHDLVMKGLLNWLTDAYMHRNFPQVFFQQIIAPIQKHVNVLKPFIPLDMLIKIENSEYHINSLMLGTQSDYFRRRIINECRGVKTPMLKVDEVSGNVFELIDEFVATGEIKNLWKIQPDELWNIIDAVAPLGFKPIVEACENVLRRYIERNQVFELLITAHRKSLQLLQNACIEFINRLEQGVRLNITPVQHLSLEFLDYKDPALEIFERLSSDITHLVFAGDMAIASQFKMVIKECPKLIGLDLSDSTLLSNYLSDIPDRIKELRLSHCQWLDNAVLKTISSVCTHLTKLDLSSNGQLTYAIWSELQKFRKLTVLDISRCYQVGDTELRVILKTCPKLTELHLSECQKITANGFFEIGKVLLDLSILNVSRTSISDPDLIDIMGRSKNLYALDISRCYNLSEKGVLEGIRNCPGLNMIDIRNTRLTVADVDQIKNKNPYLNILY